MCGERGGARVVEILSMGRVHKRKKLGVGPEVRIDLQEIQNPVTVMGGHPSDPRFLAHRFQ
jgi:hypothetical protein